MAGLAPLIIIGEAPPATGAPGGIAVPIIGRMPCIPACIGCIPCAPNHRHVSQRVAKQKGKRQFPSPQRLPTIPKNSVTSTEA